MQQQANGQGEEQAAQVGENVRRILKSVEEEARKSGRDPAEIQVMAVTKTVDPLLVNAAIDAGIHLLGENKAQELLEKYDNYNKNQCKIHFIGHLQTNKVRQIIDKVSMIESVDSLRLAGEIERQASAKNLIMPVLIEVNIGHEESKSGVFQEDLLELLEQVAQMEHLRVSGLMSIPPICENDQEMIEYFCQMHELFIDIKQKKLDNIIMETLSMGMSQDYLLAVRYGSNLLRIGTAMFGKRNYSV